MSYFLLFESASGYGLFEVTAADELAQGVDAVQQAVSNIERFGKSEWGMGGGRRPGQGGGRCWADRIGPSAALG